MLTPIQVYELSLCKFMSLNQRKTILGSFILSQFGYCPLVWIFHSRKLNNRINRLHERSLRLVYQDEESSFEELLSKDGSFTVHHRNIQKLCIELYKVAYGISPETVKSQRQVCLGKYISDKKCKNNFLGFRNFESHWSQNLDVNPSGI